MFSKKKKKKKKKYPSLMILVCVHTKNAVVPERSAI